MDFCEILYWRVLLKCVKKIQVLLKLDKALGTSHGDLSMFMMIACWFPPGMGRVSDKSCGGKTVSC